MNPLRALIVEDSEYDMNMLVRHIEHAGYELTRQWVQTADDMRAALKEKTWDVVLCDYTMPEFGGRAALEILKKSGLDIPFIVVSGTIGEETAVEMMRAGAQDYFIKGRPLTRLAAAIDREIRDAADRRKLREAESHLRQADKLAAVGQLVVGVAHEINNPLTAILGLLELLSRANLDPQSAEDIEAARNETRHCVKIVGNLLGFARTSIAQRIPTDIADVVDQALSIAQLSSGAKHKIEFVQECRGLPPISVDPGQMEQVFLNLITNAFQAMLDNKGSGRLIVRGRADNGTVRIQFIDDGPGILPEHLPKIFEPFFTTKEIGKGTGLGLSVSYGIAQEHGGRILVESAPGHGATFTVELPQSPDARVA